MPWICAKFCRRPQGRRCEAPIFETLGWDPFRLREIFGGKNIRNLLEAKPETYFFNSYFMYIFILYHVSIQYI